MKTNIFKYIFFIILIILLSTSIYILYKGENNKDIGTHNNQLQINMIRELNLGIAQYDTINPILSNNRDVQYLDKLIFDSLLDITYDFKIENSLASEFSKINNTTYLIKLKEKINWHDGTKFTAKDVIFTIENLKLNNINSIYKENVKDIQKIEQIDDYTIKIILNKEVPFFEYMMCFPIVASHSYEEGTLKSKTEVPIGTGKYRIIKISEDNIEIERIDYENETKLSKINVNLKKSTKDLYNALTKNEIDFMVTDNIEYESYIGTMGYEFNYSQNRQFEYLCLNTKNNILSDNKIRQAICYAINKKNINYNIYNNKYNICDYPLDYGNYLFCKKNIFEYDTNQAKNILIESGWILRNNKWRKQNKVLEFDLIVKQEDERRVLAAEEIKKQLEEIGIIINIVKVNDNRYNNYIKNKNYDMILTGNIISTSPNLETYFGEGNLSNFYNEEITNILNEVKNIDDTRILKDKYSRIEQIYKEELPFISLYFNSIFVLTNSNLKGDLSHNWFNLYYNIDNWYNTKDN